MPSPQHMALKQKRFEKLDYAERWMRDALSSVDHAGFFAAVEVDMSRGREVIEALRRAGVRVTYTHLLVRATAVALNRRPDLHKMVNSRRRLLPGTVDIGLSVSADMFVAPVLVIRDAARKGLLDIAKEVNDRVAVVRAQQERFLANVRRWGWLIPFGGIRKWYLRALVGQLWFRRQTVGTFQVSCLSSVDQFVPLLFSATAILGVGRVRDRVVAEGGLSAVKPTVILSCCVDHKVWDGVMAASFLNELRDLLTSEDIRSSLLAS